MRQDFDRLKIRVCIEGGYSTSEVLELLDEKKVERAVVQTGNLVAAIDMVCVAAAGL